MHGPAPFPAAIQAELDSIAGSALGAPSKAPLAFLTRSGSLDEKVVLPRHGVSQPAEPHTLLSFYCLGGAVPGAMATLAAGAAPDGPLGNRELTALALCSGRDAMLPLARELLDRGADIEACRTDLRMGSSDGCRPLHFACMHGALQMIDLLIARGARIDAKRQDGLAPLHLAAFKGDLATVQLLCEHGADPRDMAIVGRKGLRPDQICSRAWRASRHDNEECVKWLRGRCAALDCAAAIERASAPASARKAAARSRI